MISYHPLSVVAAAALLAAQADGQDTPVPSGAITATLSVDQGHPWRAPFGLERVGAAPVVHVELKTWKREVSQCAYEVVAHVDGKEAERKSLVLTAASPGSAHLAPRAFFANVRLTSVPQTVSLVANCAQAGKDQVLARRAVSWPEIQADAQAHTDRQVNPVDLGAIFPPHDWLLLGNGQNAIIEVAAISRRQDRPNTRLRVWFDGNKPMDIAAPLLSNRRLTRELQLPLTSLAERAILHVTLIDGPRTLWEKDIRTMVVRQPPKWPAFGAVETKLRYDAPVSVKDPKTGAYSSMNYDTAWDSVLKDVVVFLPNNERFVFWRGSSYIPFWAGLHNTGLTYEWAETRPPPDGVDCVEPLMDKELRYGRVHIVESTASRIHVRWTYQSTDFNYKVWGDHATEDYYFYPDGFGTRVLTLTTAPDADYEVTEFIAILPQAAYPFEILPTRLIKMLYLDGGSRDVDFPYQPGKISEVVLGNVTKESDPRPTVPRLYRIYQAKDEPASAIYFSPRDVPTIQFAMAPFYDQGEIVTPGYWGNHWPLGRGATTGGAIDERIYSSPAHISTFPWGLWSWGNRPQPLSSGQFPQPDTLGHAKNMLTQRWAWLIGKTDAPDPILLDWAHGYATPPSLEVQGASIDFPSYSAERRALRLIVEAPAVRIQLKPATHTVNPVFELADAPHRLTRVTLDGKALSAKEYAWDGATLWTQASIGPAGATLSLEFDP